MTVFVEGDKTESYVCEFLKSEHSPWVPCKISYVVLSTYITNIVVGPARKENKGYMRNVGI